MLAEVPTFQYIVQDEAGATIGEYLSTDEPPVSGELIPLEGSPAEVLGVTMMLTKRYNRVVLRVRRRQDDRT